MASSHGDSEEKEKLIVVFFFFTFFLLGILSRQVGIWLRFKSPHSIPLFAIGMTIGIYYANNPDKKLPIISEFGTSWMRNYYFPLYFFLGVYDLEMQYIHFEIIPYLAFVTIPAWIVTVFAVSSTAIKFFHFEFSWAEYAVMTAITMIPDLQITKLFVASKFNFASRRLHTLLEFECLVGSFVGSLVFMIFLDGRDYNSEETSTFVLKQILSVVVGYVMGKLATAAIIRLHHDIVNQITAAFAFIFLTFAIGLIVCQSGEITVLFMSLVMTRARPSMTHHIASVISRFIDILRFAIASSLCTLLGIVFSVKAWSLLTWEYVSLTVIINAIVFTTRFVVNFAMWSLFRGRKRIAFHQMLTLSFCNIKGCFNIVLVFTLLGSGGNDMPMVNDRLFLLATFQIVFAVFISTPLISLMFTILNRYNFDHEKIIMIQHAIKTINSYKENLVNMLRNVSFTLDADWHVVALRTSIRKSFLRKYEHHKLIIAESKMDITSIRKDAIKDVLRLQKRLIEEQFMHGTLGSRSVETIMHHLNTCMHKKMLMSAHDIIQQLAPNQQLQLIARDLNYELNRDKLCDFKPIFLIMVCVSDTFLNLCTVLTKFFNYVETAFYIVYLSQALGIVITVVSFCYVCYTGKLYCHLFAHSLWNWLAWVIYLCSLMNIAIDIITMEGKSAIAFLIVPTGKVYHLFVLSSAMLVLIRIAAILCFLESAQFWMFKFVSRILNKSTFSQCDACQGFIQVSVDTIQRVKDRIDNRVLSTSIEEVLHQECLAMRQFLGVMESLTPCIMTALKTRVACRLVLMTQQKIVNDLDNCGLLQEKEVSILTATIRHKLTALYNFKTSVTQPPMVDIIKNVPWIVMSKMNYRDIMGKGEINFCEPGDVLLSQGAHPSFIHIIIRGLVRAENKMLVKHGSQKQSTENWKSKYFIHHISTGKTDEITDFFSRGNVIGEYQFLTGSQAHKTYRCVTDVKVIAIPKEWIYEVMGGEPQWGSPMRYIEFCMWTSIAIRQGARLIQINATCQLLTRRQIYRVLEDAYVIDGLKEDRVSLENLKKAAVILLYGEMYSPAMDHLFKGPCILPLGVENLEAVRWQDKDAAVTAKEQTRNVLLVLRSYNAVIVGHGRTPFRETELEVMMSMDTYSETMTVSSGSSDGVPYARLKSEMNINEETE